MFFLSLPVKKAAAPEVPLTHTLIMFSRSLWPDDCLHYPSPPEPPILLIFPVQPKGKFGFLLISLLFHALSFTKYTA